jgi:hypothetical protein
MHVLTRTRRNANAVRAERETARTQLREWGPGDPYMSARMRAILTTFDWLDGTRPLAPATHKPRRPDDDGVGDERAEAEDLELDALRSRDGETALRARTVAETLAWVMCDPMAESPA